jgi:uncharacterized protein YkwD
METMRTHLPRLLRAALAVTLALVLTACLSSGQSAVQNELNADRRAHGRTALRSYSALNKKAQAWAERLARENRLYHSTLSSGAPSCWRALGENVGYGSSVAAVQDAYMRSDAHRANVLKTTWNWVGVGMAKNGSRVFTVQVFMTGCT